jgi:hypothetical protein
MLCGVEKRIFFIYKFLILPKKGKTVAGMIKGKTPEDIRKT